MNMRFKEWINEGLSDAPAAPTLPDPIIIPIQQARRKSQMSKNKDMPFGMKVHQATQAYAELTPKGAEDEEEVPEPEMARYRMKKK